MDNEEDEMGHILETLRCDVGEELYTIGIIEEWGSAQRYLPTVRQDYQEKEEHK